MVSTFESSSPSRSVFGKRRRSRTTAAATTGPASGPLPASSTPQTSPAQRRSILKSGIILSPNRLVATRVRARQEQTKRNCVGQLKERYLPRVFASQLPITRGNPLSGWRRGVTFLGALGTLLLLALSPPGRLSLFRTHD